MQLSSIGVFQVQNSPILDLRAGAQKLVLKGVSGLLMWPGILSAIPKQLYWHSSCFHIPPHSSTPKAATAFRQCSSSIQAGNARLVSPTSDFWILGGFFLCCPPGCRKPGT